MIINPFVRGKVLANKNIFGNIFGFKSGPGKVDLKELKARIERDPKDLKAILKLGDFYAAKGKKKKAFEYYQKAAEICIKDGFINKGIAIFKKISTLDRKNPAIYKKLAELYMRQNLFGDAILQLKKSLEMDPGNEEVKETLKKLSGTSDKKQTLVEAIRADNEAVILSQSATQEAILVEAKRQIREQLSNKDFMEHFDLGVAYMEMELHESAIEEFTLTLNSDKYFEESVRLIYENFFAMDRLQDAVNYFYDLLKRPDFTSLQKSIIRFYIAKAYEDSLNTSKALEIYNELLDTEYPRPDELIRSIKRLKPSGQPDTFSQ